MERIVYDREAALDRVGGDSAMALRFLDMLLALLEESEQALSAALERHDMTALKEGAHRLAGAACYCGANTIYLAARRLESAAESQDSTLADTSVTELVHEFDQFRAVVSRGSIRE